MAVISRDMAVIVSEGGTMRVSFTYDNVTMTAKKLVFSNSCPFTGKMNMTLLGNNSKHAIDVPANTNSDLVVPLLNVAVLKNTVGDILFPFDISLRRN